MQIIGLHKNLYKLYAYSLSQECLDVYRNQYEDGVRRWSSLKVEGVCDQKCQQFSGISRSTYYRYKWELVKLK
jgi:hypothetical protein